MDEVEVKILEINKNQIEEKLSSIGAKKVFDGDILTVIFDFEDGSIRKEKNVLRLRQDSQKTELTYKKIRFTNNAKIAEEYSVEVSDFEIMVKILQNLGLSVVEKMNKHRVSYKLDNVRFDIDRYYGAYGFIPEFLEIEGEIDLIHKYATLLGFEIEDCLPWSTQDLIRKYSKNSL